MYSETTDADAGRAPMFCISPATVGSNRFSSAQARGPSASATDPSVSVRSRNARCRSPWASGSSSRDLGRSRVERVGLARRRELGQRSRAPCEPAVTRPRQIGEHDPAVELPPPARRVDQPQLLGRLRGEPARSIVRVEAALERAFETHVLQPGIFRTRHGDREDLDRDDGLRRLVRSGTRRGAEQQGSERHGSSHCSLTPTVNRKLNPGS